MRTFARERKIDNPSDLSAQQQAEFAAGIMRMCLAKGSSEHVAYVDPAKEKGPASARPVTGGAKLHVGRNAPCPCGSGRKFKKCCGKPS
jgi:uncharacterized protein YecA (UPF0149 family)